VGAQIVLLSAAGVGTNGIMRQTGKSKTCVWRWQERFMAEGFDGLLHDKRLKWLHANCSTPARTATLYMRLAKSREWLEAQNGNVADLPLRGADMLIRRQRGKEALIARRAANGAYDAAMETALTNGEIVRVEIPGGYSYHRSDDLGLPEPVAPEPPPTPEEIADDIIEELASAHPVT
jgi:hypothetical protein